MAYSAKQAPLTKLGEQLNRPADEIVAYRRQKPLLVAELNAAVHQLVTQLAPYRTLRWALYCHDSFNFVVGLLALFYSGKQPVLLSSDSPYYLNSLALHFDAVLSDDSAFYAPENKPAITFAPLSDSEVLLKTRANCDVIKPAALLDDTQSLILFTSGSTGLPKPIKKTLYQLQQESQILADYWSESFANTLFIASVAHHHLYGLTFKILLSLALRVPFVAEPLYYQEQLFAYQHKALTLISSPTLLKTLDRRLASLSCKLIFSAGGPLSYLEAKLTQHSLGVIPHEIYGSSETGIIATRQQQNDTPIAWQLFPTIQLTPLSHQQASLSSPLLLTNCEVLNDKIQFIQADRFHLLGRTDKIIKIAEQRISLTMIEYQLSQLPQLAQVVTFPFKENQRTFIVVVAVLTAEGKAQHHQLGKIKFIQCLRQRLRVTMPPIALPKRWRFVDTIPLNSQGKYSIVELSQLFKP